MGKKDDFKGGSIGNEHLAHRGDKGWDNPRDDDRQPGAGDFSREQAAADAARIASRQK